uniref:Uncharacterized protein n=1 Tax=Oryza sativa subsp. japonica TaxID=39947 RepID=Q6H4F5_ORYSJ|nr:hypothetical protein [Oryza sativa Japonica Group]
MTWGRARARAVADEDDRSGTPFPRNRRYSPPGWCVHRSDVITIRELVTAGPYAGLYLDRPAGPRASETDKIDDGDHARTPVHHLAALLRDATPAPASHARAAAHEAAGSDDVDRSMDGSWPTQHGSGAGAGQPCPRSGNPARRQGRRGDLQGGLNRIDE